MKYTLLMRANHWLLGIMIIILLGVGLWMESLPGDYPGKFDYYALHKSFGLVALFYVIFRLSVRLRSRVPTLPREINTRDAVLSALTIFALYLLMFAMPISGYLMSSYGGHPVKLFGLDIPAIVDKDPRLGSVFHNIHGIGGKVFIGLIVLHILGTLKHLLVEKVNLINRIW